MRFIAFLLALFTAAVPLCAREAPVDYVNPFVGTLADFGQLSPAAVAPFGMVQLGPDTDPANHAGYDFAAPTIVGFSHTRAVGVGCGGGGGDLLVMANYADAPRLAAIDKAGEQARAGYYAVRYGEGILAEATATRGAAILRFTMPKAGTINLRIDPRHSYAKRLAVRWDHANSADMRLSLSAGTVCDAGAYHLHTASLLTHNGRTVTRSLAPAADDSVILPLDVKAGDIIELRTGLSSIDSLAARNVRERELGKTSFATIAGRTRTDWNKLLGRITIDGTAEQRGLLYTSLFRVLQTPVAIADPDGRYRGSDGKIGTVAKGHQYYTSWALWDNYRTQLPLIALLYPERASDIAHSLTLLFGQGKQRWSTKTEPFITVRTEHAGVALLDFYRKGIGGFDPRAALSGMVAESPSLARETPDEMIETAYDEWAIAELAKDLGDPVTEQRFRQAALAYRPMWRETFETLGDDADVVKARGLYQGTLWQYRWAPVFDLEWISATLGEDRFNRELEEFFDRNLFNMTNQPDMQVPFIPAWAGNQAMSDRLVHRILTQPIDHPYTNAGKRPEAWRGRSFALAPQGFADGMDDDAGAMSAWYIWASLGLYPLVPGEPWYVVTEPLHAKAKLRLPHGKSLTILGADQRLPQDRIIPARKGRVEHSQIITGGVLTTNSARSSLIKRDDEG